MTDNWPIALLATVVVASMGAAISEGIRWLAGRTALRTTAQTQKVHAGVEVARVRTEEAESTVRQLSILIGELATARDRDRVEQTELRATVDRLEAQVKVLVTEARQQTAHIVEQSAHIVELREMLRAAGGEPPETPVAG